MQYLVRSLKTLIQYTLLFGMVNLILYFLASAQGKELADMWQEGSLPKIAMFFVAMAFVYPLVGYVKKEAYMKRSLKNKEEKDKIVEIFENAGFRLDKEDNEKMTFVLRSKAMRVFRLYDDAIEVVDASESFIMVSGKRKDVYRIIRAIDYKNQQEEEQQVEE